MKYFLFFSVFFLPPFLAQSQTKFQRTFGTTSNEGVAAFPTSDGGYIISGIADQGSYPPWNPTGYISKTDSLLNTIWTREYANPNLSYTPFVLMENSDGGFFIGQHFYIGASWDHACLIKTNSNGDTIWAKRGGINPTVMYQNTDGGYTLIEGNLMAKTDSSFNILWEKFYKPFTGCNPAQQTNDGGYIFIGDTKTGTNANAFGLHVLKTDSLGVTQWSKTYSHSSGYLINALGMKAIEQTNDGGYIFIGSDSIDGQWLDDVIIIKADASGNIQWTKTYGGSGNDRGISIRNVQGGVGYIFTARTFGVESPQNSKRTMMVRIDGNGNVMWGKMYGHVAANQLNADDIADGVEITLDGGFMFSGATQETGINSYDGWLVKTDANGVSGCNEVSTYPLTTIPNLIIGTGGTDSTVTPIQFTQEGPLTIGAWQLPDSILCQTFPIGIQETASVSDNEINIYPNPTSGVFNLKMGQFENLKMKSIEIYNVYGEKIFYNNHFQINSSSNLQIDLSSQPDGIYFVRINTSAGMLSKKVVVLR